jgi:phospholipid-binding lipoprotein MlaA
MRHCSYLWGSVLCAFVSTTAFAAEQNPNHDSSAEMYNLSSLKQLKQLRLDQFKVNASATQSEEVKDPLQPFNRQMYAFNDVLDRNVVRPIAVQYNDKFPEQVRGSLTQARKNLDEPWNAVNQLIQGKPLRSLKTLGRFTFNTLTTLGFADPAGRLGLDSVDEDFGTTLGYYGVPSGPYLILPFMGPSTIRDSLGRAVDSQARVQKYVLDDQDGLYWSEIAWHGIDGRARLLNLEDFLQGDKYAAIRDIYLQRKNSEIAQKRGDADAGISFIEDEFDDTLELDEQQLEVDQ